MNTRMSAFCLSACLSAGCLSANAASPETITYQGRLVDAGGPANGARAMVFEVYDVPSGGERLFCETNSPVCSDGLFSTSLGQSSPANFVAALAGGQVWLQVSVGGQPLGGRQRLLAAPYAIHAGSAPLAAGSVSNIHIAAGAVNSSKLAAGAVTSDALANGAVTAAALASGAVTSNAVALGAVGLAALADDARLALHAGAETAVADAGALALEGESSFFGYSLALFGGGRLAAAETRSGTEGIVHVYGADGAPLLIVTNPASMLNHAFGHALVGAGDGSLIVGSLPQTVPVPQPNAVFVYRTNGELRAAVTNPTPMEAYDNFGYAVAAIGSDRFAVGAPWSDPGAVTNSGVVYLYALDGSAVAAITNPRPAVSCNFGQSVAGLGDGRLLVGAPGASFVSTSSGAAYLYTRDGAPLCCLTNPAPTGYDQFGAAVARVGSGRFLVGAPGHDAGAANAGAAFLYAADGRLLATLRNPTPTAEDAFGSVLAEVDVDKFLVSVPYAGVADVGIAHLYWSDGAYIGAVTNPASGAFRRFGFAVAGLGGNRFAVTALENDSLPKGRVWLYRAGSTLGWLQVAAGNLASGAVTSEALAAGAVTANALASGSVTAGALARGSVTAVALADGAVTSVALSPGAVGARELACRFAAGGPTLVTNPVPYEFGAFGASVADLGASGFLVGASGDDVGGEDRAGAIYWYGADGAFRMTVTNPVPSVGDSFGGVLAPLGNGGFAVGAMMKWAGAYQSGVVHLFDSNGARQLTVTNPVPSEEAHFGCSVAGVGPDRLVAGAYGQTVGGAAYSGVAHLLAADGALLMTVTNPTPAASEEFGYAVAGVGADRFAVGAPQDNMSYAGAVYLYGASGTLLATLPNPAPTNGDFFGGSLAAVGADRFVVGARDDSPGGISGAGSAWLYRSDGTLVGAVTNPAPAAGGHFGERLWRVGADKFAVGSPYAIAGGVTNVGAAHLYWADGTYIMTLTNPAAVRDDYFGVAVCGTGAGGIVVGASGRSRGPYLSNGGVAWLYPTECLLSGVAVDRLAAGSVTSGALATGAVTANALAAGAVTSSALGSGAVTENALARGSVTTAALATGAVTSNALATGSVTAAALASQAVTAGALSDGAVSARVLEGTTTLTNKALVRDNRPGGDDYFGGGVAGLSRGRFAVGSLSPQGDVDVYDACGVFVMSVTNPAPVAFSRFGQALAPVGDGFVAGDAIGGQGGTESGAAYLFGANGALLATVANPAEAEGAHFGWAVAAAASGGFASGTPEASPGGLTNAGAAYVFAAGGALLGTLTNPAPEFHGRFGAALAPAPGGALLVGAPGDVYAASGGSAHLYGADGALRLTVTNPALHAYIRGRFGSSLAAVGTGRFVVGAPCNDGGLTNYAGAAYLYSTNGALLAALRSPEAAAYRHFGAAVAAVGNDKFLVTEPGDPTFSSAAGAAWLYWTDGTLVGKVANPAPTEDDEYGYAAAGVGQDGLVVGARGEDGAYENAGAAWLFEARTEVGWLRVAAGNLTAGAVTSDALAVGAVTEGALASGAVTAGALASGSVTSNAMAAGAVGLAGLAEDARLALRGGASTAVASAGSVALEGESSFFGYSLALFGGGRLAAGETRSGTEGIVHVYGADGAPLLIVTNPASLLNHAFGCALAGAGDGSLIVSSLPQTGPVPQPNAVFVYGTNGALRAAVTNPTPMEAYDNFGTAVAAVGPDRFAVGAPWSDHGAVVNSGLVYLYDLAGAALATVTNPVPSESCNFGQAVAGVGEDRLLVGAPGADFGSSAAGAAYLFTRDGALLGCLTNPAPTGWDQFGAAVARVGAGRFLVGAPGYDAGATNAGAAFLYSSDGRLLATLRNPSPAAADAFGSVLAEVDADKFLVGVPYAGASDLGVAHLYWSDGTYIGAVTNPASGAFRRFGYAVAGLGGNRFAVTALENDSLPKGRVWLYRADSTLGWLQVASGNLASGAVTSDALAAGAVTANALASGSVTAGALARGSVTAVALADSAVTAGALAAGAVGARELACRFTAGGPTLVTNPVPYEFGAFGVSAADLGAAGFLVGASGDDVGGEDRAGAIYWYGADGAFRMTVTNPVPSVGDSFGGVLAPLGSGGFAVGAMMKWAGAYQSGVVHLFGLNGARQLTVTNPVPSSEAHFGCSVAAVGPDRLVAGAYGQTVGGAAYSGVAHLLSADGARLLTVTNPTPEASEMFGYAVAGVGAERFAVGAPQDNMFYAGAVYLYNASGALLATLLNPAPESGDFFGGSLVSAGSDRFVVGARDDNPGGRVGAGAAWLYRSDGTLVGAVTNPSPAAGGHFGERLWRVGADKFAVGAPYAVASGVTNAGVAHLYWVDGTYIMTLTNPAAAREDYFGMAVCGTGAGGIVVGASGRSRGTWLGQAGAAWLYPTESLLSGVAVDRLAAGSVTAGAMAGGAVTSAALAAGAVTSDALATGAVTASALAAGAVTSNALAVGAVTSNALATGSVTTAALAARAVTSDTLADGAVTMRALAGQTVLTNTAKITEARLPVNSGFGSAVLGLPDGRVLVGAAGEVSLYGADGAWRWSVDSPLSGPYAPGFGEALSRLGTELFAVGEGYCDDVDAPDSGVFHLFRPDGSSSLTVTNPAPAAEAHFGRAVVGLASDRVAAGAPEASLGGMTNAGAAYLFSAGGALLSVVTNPAPEAHGRFGAALAAAPGGALLVGAPGDIYAASGGAAHLYGANGALRLTVTNPAPDAYIRGRFGSSLAAIGRDRFVVGAPYNAGGGINYAGAAYLYSTNGALLVALQSPEAAAYGHFGASVAPVGADKILVTEPGDTLFSSAPGAAWLYWADGTLIGKVANPEPTEDDEFGCAAAAVGQDGFLVGARGEEVSFGGHWITDAGVVWRFSAQTAADWLRVTAANLTASSVTSDALASGAVTSDALAGGAVTAGALASGAVTSNAMAQGAVELQSLAQDARSALHAGADTAVSTNRMVAWAQSESLGVALARTGDGLLAVGDFLTSGYGAFHLLTADGALRLSVTNPTPAGYDCFAYALAGLAAEQLVVGAHRDGAGAFDTGAAYVYRTDGTLLVTVTNPAPEAYDHFGKAVAAVGADRFAVGAPDDDPDAVTNSGTIYLYTSAGAAVTTVSNPTPQGYGGFGSAVASVGADRLLVGAPGTSLSSASSGAAYLFTRDGAPLCCLTNPAPTAYDHFGETVARVGADRFLVGAPGCDAGAQNAGAAYLYWADGRLLATLRNPSPVAEDAFGSMVADAGNGMFLVGAPDAVATHVGIAHLYWADGSYIGPVTNPAPAFVDRFGYAAAGLGGGRIAVSAVGDGSSAGKVWLLEAVSALGWLTVSANNLAAGSVGSAALASGAVTSNALSAGCVGSVALAAGAVTSNALLSGCVGRAALAAGAVTSNALSAGCVGTAALAASAVTSNILANGSVTSLALARAAVTGEALAPGEVELMHLSTAVLVVEPQSNSAPVNVTMGQFGQSVAELRDGGFAIGAVQEVWGAGQGRVYLYRPDGSFRLTLTNLVPLANEKFSFSLDAVGGDSLAVSAPYETSTGGRVHLFRSDGLLLATVTNPTPSMNDRFGYSVAGVGGDRFVVGSPEDDAGATDSGVVHLYGASGNLMMTVTNPTVNSSDYFGRSVAAVGEGLFVVGAPGDDTGASGAGAAYLFSSSGTRLMTLTNPTLHASSQFGSAVAGIGSGCFIVAAPYDDYGVADAGVVHLYRENGERVMMITNPAPVANDRFGSALARIGDSMFAVGTPLGDPNATTNAGVVHVYWNDGRFIASITNPVPLTGDMFGVALAGSSGGKIMIGCSQKDGAYEDQGAAYLYAIESFLPGLTVGAGGLAPGAVTSGAIAPGAVSSVHIAVGSITADRLVDGSGSGLEADLLDGLDSAYFRDVGNVNTGTLATARFSAYTDLSDEGKLDNNADADLLTRLQADGRFSAAGHAHDTNYVRKAGDTMWGGLTVTGTLSVVGSASVTGRVTAASFAGDGAALTNLSGAALQAGSVSNAHIAAGSITADRLVQGAGSGLDADLLDGLHAAAFSSSGHAHPVYLLKAGDAMWGGLTVTGALSVIGSASVTGRVTAAAFAGDGSLLTNVSGAALQAGSISNAQLAAGTLTADRLVDGAGSGLDADQLDGQDSSYYRDAGNVNAGTLATARYSAYADLSDEGKLDNSADSDLLTRLQSDGRFATSGHAHDASYVKKGGDAMSGMLTNAVGIAAHRVYNLNNTDVSDWSVALGGRYNYIASGSSYSVVGGGLDNNIASGALYGVVVGGSGNNIGGSCGSAFIGGGSGNAVETNADNAVIGGGDGNKIGPDALSSLIAGGALNSIGTNGDYVAIGGGYDNDIGTNATYSTVSGGRNNDIAHNVWCGTITGGNYHDIGLGSSCATIDGGYINQVGTNAQYSTIVGGAQNAVADNALYAFAAGHRAQANHSGAFVWADSYNGDFASTNSDSFNVRCRGGVRFAGSSGGSNQSVAWMPGDGSWTFSSDRNLKDNFQPVDGEAVLQKVAALPMTEWNYAGYEQRHIGPMAQDFHAAFPLNGNGTTLNSLDLDGVAFAAIQGLYRRNEALKADAEDLRRENAELRARIERLERVLAK